MLIRQYLCGNVFSGWVDLAYDILSYWDLQEKLDREPPIITYIKYTNICWPVPYNIYNLP